jgi:hypothetical protein
MIIPGIGKVGQFFKTFGKGFAFNNTAVEFN